MKGQNFLCFNFNALTIAYLWLVVKIGNITLNEFPLLLAPMEDVSDPPFRAVCKEFGADVVYTEFISSEGLIRDAIKSRQKLDIFQIKKFGIKANDIATTALNIRPEYEYKDGQRVLTGNNVSRQVDINLRDLKKYPEMMKALVDAKISETINTNLTLADKKAVEEKVQTAAMDDAKARGGVSGLIGRGVNMAKIGLAFGRMYLMKPKANPLPQQIRLSPAW